MTDVPVAPPDEQIFGTAKRMTLELNKLPLHSHAATVAMMQMMVEHRKIELQNQHTLAQQKAQQEAMDEARQRHAQAQVQREADEAARKRLDDARRLQVVNGAEKVEAVTAQ